MPSESTYTITLTVKDTEPGRARAKVRQTVVDALGLNATLVPPLGESPRAAHVLGSYGFLIEGLQVAEVVD